MGANVAQATRLPIAQFADGDVARFAAHNGGRIRKGAPMAYIWAMSKGKRETEWRVIRLRSKRQYLGTVKAADHDAAVKAAVKQFGLDKEEAERLLLRQYK
jgi:hypothetical protein